MDKQFTQYINELNDIRKDIEELKKIVAILTEQIDQKGKELLIKNDEMQLNDNSVPNFNTVADYDYDQVDSSGSSDISDDYSDRRALSVESVESVESAESVKSAESGSKKSDCSPLKKTSTMPPIKK